jgi:hypothetical protein
VLLSPDQLPSSHPTSPQEIAAVPAPVCFEGGWPLVADRPDAPAPRSAHRAWATVGKVAVLFGKPPSPRPRCAAPSLLPLADPPRLSSPGQTSHADGSGNKRRCVARSRLFGEGSISVWARVVDARAAPTRRRCPGTDDPRGRRRSLRTSTTRTSPCRSQ